MLEVVAGLLAEGRSNAEIWQALVDEGVEASTATGHLTLVGRVLQMLKAGRSKADVWHSLVAGGAPAETVTAAVSAVADAFSPAALGLIPCSACGALFPSAGATLSRGGDPICGDCVDREAAAEQQARADRSMGGPAATVRRCRRCQQPAMRCVRVTTHVRRGQTHRTYEFVCRGCAHSFEGSDSLGRYVTLLVGIGAVVWGLVQLFEPRRREPAPLAIVAGLALGAYSLYQILIWRLYPEVPDP